MTSSVATLIYDQFTIHCRKKDSGCTFKTTIPYEPNTACKAQKKASVLQICPCAEDIE